MERIPPEFINYKTERKSFVKIFKQYNKEEIKDFLDELFKTKIKENINDYYLKRYGCRIKLRQKYKNLDKILSYIEKYIK